MNETRYVFQHRASAAFVKFLWTDGEPGGIALTDSISEVNLFRTKDSITKCLTLALGDGGDVASNYELREVTVSYKLK